MSKLKLRACAENSRPNIRACCNKQGGDNVKIIQLPKCYNY